MSIASKIGGSTTKRVDELETIGAEVVDNMQSLVDRVESDNLDHTTVKSVFEQLLDISTTLHTVSHLAPAQLLGTSSVLQLAGGSTNAAPALTGGSTAPAPGADDIVLTGTAAAQFRTLMGASRDAETMMNLIFDVFGPLASLDTRTQVALISVISDIAVQTPDRKVNMGSGKLESEERLAAVTTELSTARAQKQSWIDRYATLDSKVTTGADDRMIAKRLIGLHDLTDLLVDGDAGLEIARDGHVSLAAAPAAPAPTPPNDATAAFLDLVEHGNYSGGFGSRWTFKAKKSDLQQETVDAMTAIKPVE